MLNAELSGDDRACLEDFTALRRALYEEVNGAIETKEDDATAALTLHHYRSATNEDVGTHELLIAEADSVLRLADEQWEFGLKYVLSPQRNPVSYPPCLSIPQVRSHAKLPHCLRLLPRDGDDGAFEGLCCTSHSSSLCCKPR